MFFGYFFFGFGFFVILFYGVHYLFILLGLEILLLSVFFLFCVSYVASFLSMNFFIYLLVLVCMGGFSISLLVFLSRFFGRDFWFFGFLF